MPFVAPCRRPDRLGDRSPTADHDDGHGSQDDADAHSSRRDNERMSGL
jgi:hypothetical protein